MRHKKSASSHDEAALLGKKYHIAAKVKEAVELCKLFRQKINLFLLKLGFFTVFGEHLEIILFKCFQLCLLVHILVGMIN